MRTDEWQKDISGMLTTALAEVYEPGEVRVNGEVRQHETVIMSPEAFGMLMQEAGYRQTVHGEQA